MAITGGAGSVLGKYFNSLSVPSLLGHEKVTLFPADDLGNKVIGSNLLSTSLPGEGRIKALANQFKDKVNSIGNSFVSDEKKYGAMPIKVEIDSCKSFIYQNSVTSTQFSTESRKVFLDSNIKNPVTISINGYFENTKMKDLQRLSEPDMWMYVVNYKNFDGVANRINFKQIGKDYKLFYITSLTITDLEYSNMFQAQIELKEALIFEPVTIYTIYDSKIVQTNTVTGNSTVGQPNAKPIQTVPGGHIGDAKNALKSAKYSAGVGG